MLLFTYAIIAVVRRWGISKAHRRLAILLIASFLWVVTRTLENFPTGFFNLLFHLDFALAALVAAAMVLFAIHYPKQNNKLTIIKETLLATPLIIVSLLSLTEIFSYTNGFRDLGYTSYYFIYIGFLILYFILITGYFFIKKYFYYSGIEKQKLGYITIGYLIAILILLFDSIRSALLSGYIDINIDLLYVNGSILFSVFIVFVILRYRFMDIKVVVRKGVIYAISLVATLAIYTYLALLFKNTIEESWNINSTWTAIVLIALVALGFPPLKKIVERSINTLFKGRKSIDLAVKELKEKIVTKTDIQILDEIICNQVKEYLNIDQVKLFLLNHKESKFFHPDKELHQDVIDINNDLIKYFQKNNNVLIREEINHLLDEAGNNQDKDLIQKAEKEIKKLKAGLVIPFVADQEVFGLLVLGEHRKKEAYTIQDVKYLEQLREQVSVVLANAIQYQEAMERIQAGIPNS